MNLPNGWEANTTDEGLTWEYLYKGGTPKDVKKSKELPPFKVIEEIDEAYAQAFDKMVVEVVKDISKYLMK